MIARLRGALADKKPGEAIIDVGGVGYQVFTSLNTFCVLPEPGETVELEVITNLREGALELFGFAETGEKELFGLLRGVSGIGPRLALSILSGINAEELVAVLAEGALDRLVAVPGVGKKTAERILVDLKGKVDDLAVSSSIPTGPSTAIENDAVLALVSLGYKRADARKAVTASQAADKGANIEALIKRSLAQLT